MHKLLLLIAPPASGKTFWIKNFADSLTGQTLLIISPLRALADECRENWPATIKVMTPEEWLFFREPAAVVVFDEFHLYHYWGSSFRPRMWEVFYALASEASLTVLLTATAGNELVTELETYRCHFDEVLVADFGNRRLRFAPVRYVKVPSDRLLATFLDHLPSGRETTLVFCAFRDEVHRWEERLRRRGLRVWGCVGGEAQKMRALVKSGERPDVIVATSVLSHGVNLPPISRIVFLYPLENVDFWIQMVARGGRRGERYEVFSLERPHGITWNRPQNFFTVLGLRWRLSWWEFKRDLERWFSKASS